VGGASANASYLPRWIYPPTCCSKAYLEGNAHFEYGHITGQRHLYFFIHWRYSSSFLTDFCHRLNVPLPPIIPRLSAVTIHILTSLPWLFVTTPVILATLKVPIWFDLTSLYTSRAIKTLPGRRTELEVESVLRLGRPQTQRVDEIVVKSRNRIVVRHGQHHLRGQHAPPQSRARMDCLHPWIALDLIVLGWLELGQDFRKLYGLDWMAVSTLFFISNYGSTVKLFMRNYDLAI